MKIIGKMGKGKIYRDEKAKFSILLDSVAKKADIAEGKRAVEDIIRVIYRHQPISTKKIAQKTRLPLPIVAKVRTILERERILKRTERGAELTELGIEFAENFLKLKYKKSLTCSVCNGRGIVLDEFFEDILNRVKVWAKKRPLANTTIDQSFATPETSTYRVALMYERGDLEGKRILFVGDDDLTSLPAALTNMAEEIAVVDIDERILKLIEKFSQKEGVKIRTIKHNLRNPLPDDLKESFDVISTDPPYTVNGLKLFLSRGIEALGKEGIAYLSYSHKPIDEWLSIQKAITNMGFVISELIPNFNYYEGSEIIANTTFIARLIGRDLKAEIGDTEKIYTGLVKPVIRYYKCLKCGKIHKVGEEVKKVEDLVCECGGKKFKMVKREKIKE
ncbi:bis-aminopropyl spermidine synthase family protein [Methanocaldococcus fervens]|nr:bis-aminopropyl spermidine synthase family protein [Methanocaldococcus fervens]